MHNKIPTADTTPSPTPQSTPSPSTELKSHFSSVGAFKGTRDTVEGLSAALVNTPEEAAARLRSLKEKINELQKKRERYWTRQGVTGGLALASVAFTAGTSLLVQGPVAVHTKGRLGSLKEEIVDMLQQINRLREMFGECEEVRRVEEEVAILESVFRHGIERAVLRGGL